MAGKRTYKLHTLTVENSNGQPISNATYLWDFPPGFLVPTPDFLTSASVETKLVGKYRVAVSFGSTTCNVEVNLSSDICTPVGDSYVCGSAPSGTITVPPIAAGTVFLENLAPNDEFTAADYTVTVIKITGGNAQSGWSGDGSIGFNLMGSIGNAPVRIGLDVTLTNIRLNDCYQMVEGEVITKYDPEWGNVVNLDKLLARLKPLENIFYRPTSKPKHRKQRGILAKIMPFKYDLGEFSPIFKIYSFDSDFLFNIPKQKNAILAFFSNLIAAGLNFRFKNCPIIYLKTWA